MKAKKVSCLPVMDDGKLVGIITETDLFNAFMDLLGFTQKGTTRITIDIREDKVGVLAKLTSIFKAENVNINNIAVFRDNLQVVIRVNTLDVDAVLKTLADNDFKVSHVMKKEN